MIPILSAALVPPRSNWASVGLARECRKVLSDECKENVIFKIQFYMQARIYIWISIRFVYEAWEEVLRTKDFSARCLDASRTCRLSFTLCSHPEFLCDWFCIGFSTERWIELHLKDEDEEDKCNTLYVRQKSEMHNAWILHPCIPDKNQISIVCNGISNKSISQNSSLRVVIIRNLRYPSE